MFGGSEWYIGCLGIEPKEDRERSWSSLRLSERQGGRKKERKEKTVGDGKFVGEIVKELNIHLYTAS